MFTIKTTRNRKPIAPFFFRFSNSSEMSPSYFECHLFYITTTRRVQLCFCLFLFWQSLTAFCARNRIRRCSDRNILIHFFTVQTTKCNCLSTIKRFDENHHLKWCCWRVCSVLMCIITWKWTVIGCCWLLRMANFAIKRRNSIFKCLNKIAKKFAKYLISGPNLAMVMALLCQWRRRT